jgi:hypothetical protein
MAKGVDTNSAHTVSACAIHLSSRQQNAALLATEGANTRLDTAEDTMTKSTSEMGKSQRRSMREDAVSLDGSLEGPTSFLRGHADHYTTLPLPPDQSAIFIDQADTSKVLHKLDDNHGETYGVTAIGPRSAWKCGPRCSGSVDLRKPPMTCTKSNVGSLRIHPHNPGADKQIRDLQNAIYHLQSRYSTVRREYNVSSSQDW